jgi:hypothetical protein
MRKADQVGSSFISWALVSLGLLGCSSAKAPADAAASLDGLAVADGLLPSDGAAPGSLPTLDTGVDRAALTAALLPYLKAVVATLPGSDPESVQVGRPWGQFEVHKGPRLVFRGRWRVLVSIDGNWAAVADAIRDGDGYKAVGIGSAGLVPIMLTRESVPAISAALDRGRAGLLRAVGDGGDSLLAYEPDAPLDAGDGLIMVQSLGTNAWFRGIDGGAGGFPEMTLAELDPFLPAE